MFKSPGRDCKARGRAWPWLGSVGPVSYRGHDAVRREIQLQRASDPGPDAFLTSTAPASLDVYRDDVHYAEDEEYLYARPPRL